MSKKLVGRGVGRFVGLGDGRDVGTLVRGLSIKLSRNDSGDGVGDGVGLSVTGYFVGLAVAGIGIGDSAGLFVVTCGFGLGFAAGFLPPPVGLGLTNTARGGGVGGSVSGTLSGVGMARTGANVFGGMEGEAVTGGLVGGGHSEVQTALLLQYVSPEAGKDETHTGWKSTKNDTNLAHKIQTWICNACRFCTEIRRTAPTLASMTRA